MPKFKSLEQWFNRLIRSKMQGPALATAGIAVGLVIMTAGLVPWGRPAQEILIAIGLMQVGCSSLLFVGFTIVQLLKSVNARGDGGAHA
jgi:hypothetical protein